MKTTLLIIGLFIGTALIPIKAQTDLLFSNSGMNALVFNPAVMETNQMINASVLVRRQWAGFPDAPGVEQINLRTFFDDHHMGVKFSALNFSAGNELTRRLNLAYTYSVQLSQESHLFFGLGAGLYQRQIQFSKLIFEDGNEPLVRPDETYYRPDFEFGVHFRTRKYIAGYAANHLGTNTKEATLSRIPLHQHAYGGMYHELVPDVQLFTGLSYHNQGIVSYFQADIHLIFDRFNAGIGWRNKDAFIIKTGLEISEMISILYSYDMGINRFANFNSGSHEFVLQLQLERKNRAYLSPRFMDY